MAQKKTKTKAKKPKRSASPAAKTSSGEGKSSRRFHEGFGIVTLAAAILLGPSLFTVQVGDGKLMGPFGQAVGSALNWLLGASGYLLVAALVAVALRIFAGGLGLIGEGKQERTTLWRERLGLGLGLLSVSLLLHLVARPQRVGGASLGGILGELSAELLCSLVSTPGTWVVGLAGLALAVVLATSVSWARLGLGLAHWIPRALGRTAESIQAGLQQLRHNVGALVQAARRGPAAAEVEPSGEAALPPVIRLDMRERKARPLKREQPAPQPPESLPKDLEIGVEAAPPERPTICVSDPADSKPATTEPDVPAPVIKPPVDKKPAAKSSKVAELTIVESRFQNQEEQTEDEPEQEKQVEQTDGPGFVLHGETYKLPPLSLLDEEHTQKAEVDEKSIFDQAERLVSTLADYKIQGRITEVRPGPVVTMYEFVPAPGIRISKVASLADDLAMSLSAERVRIVAPIPGKGAIGIEVPNEKRETVFFKEIVAHKAFRKGKSPLTLAMGKNILGAAATLDLAKMPHLLVAGATGAGKSVSINTMICSLLMRNTPEEVRLIMVDPKFLELTGYNDIPHLLLPVVTDPKKANTALRWAVNEMERRYQLLADMRVRDIASFNRKVEKLRGEAEQEQDPATPKGSDEALAEAAPSKVVVVKRKADGSEATLTTQVEPGDQPAPNAEQADQPAAAAPVPPAPRRARKGPRRLPHIVVVIDEFADLMMVASKEVETSVARLAQKARAAGIHVILATQRPSVDVITGLIKANFPSRVSFRVAQAVDSKTILGRKGAEQLLGSGDMLLLDRGSEMKRLHGAYISDGEIQRVVDWLKKQGKPIYDMDILRPRDDEEGDDTDQEQDKGGDEMYDRAVSLVAEMRKCSISSIQRHLRVGYNRAARMVERMEREGVVGPPGHRGVREVLVQDQ